MKSRESRDKFYTASRRDSAKIKRKIYSKYNIPKIREFSYLICSTINFVLNKNLQKGILLKHIPLNSKEKKKLRTMSNRFPINSSFQEEYSFVKYDNIFLLISEKFSRSYNRISVENKIIFLLDEILHGALKRMQTQWNFQEHSITERNYRLPKSQTAANLWIWCNPVLDPFAAAPRRELWNKIGNGLQCTQVRSSTADFFQPETVRATLRLLAKFPKDSTSPINMYAASPISRERAIECQAGYIVWKC